MNILEQLALSRWFNDQREFASLCSCFAERSPEEEERQREFEDSLSVLSPREIDEFTGESTFDPSDDGTPRDYFQPRWSRQ